MSGRVKAEDFETGGIVPAGTRSWHFFGDGCVFPVAPPRPELAGDVHLSITGRDRDEVLAALRQGFGQYGIRFVPPAA